MTGHGTKFGRKREDAIVALLTQRNVEEAARSVGLGTRTLMRWLQVPEFQVEYREARRAAFLQSTARLQQAAPAAVTTLLKVMVDPTAPAAAKVRAAVSVLDRAAKGIEMEDLDARLAALEYERESSCDLEASQSRLHNAPESAQPGGFRGDMD